ncbi:MAG: hypothetical protein AB7P40_22495 [Chloroflexota bacterium]
MEMPGDLQDVRVVHFGLGQLGAAMARAVSTRSGLVSVAAVDQAASREGRDLGDVAGIAGGATGILVEATPARLHDIEADVVLFAPEGDVDAATTDLELLLEVGLNVVMVFPELAYAPDEDGDDLAMSMDTLAREAEVTALVLDPCDALLGTLPLTLTSVCSSVDHVAIRRGGVAGPLGRLSAADWGRSLAQSIGWALDDLDERENDPVGTHRIVGSSDGREVLVVEVTSGGTGLEVEIQGTPSLKLTVMGGNNPEQELANLAVNAIPAVLTGDPGLYTLAELPPVHSWTSLGLMPADEAEDDDDE